MDEAAYENFRNLVLKAAESRQDPPLRAESRSIIETRLEKIRPLIHDQPNHPTYHSMIFEAIRELNGGMGSSEEAISNFMKKMHKNLPWIHSTFLKHHLNNLCASGQILITHDKLYTESKDAKSICWKNHPKKYGNHGAIEKARKLEELDERMDGVEVDKSNHPPIILRFRIVSHDSDTTDAGVLCSDPKPKTPEHEELMLVPHPKMDEGKDPNTLLQFGRGKRNKCKTNRVLINVDQKELQGPTTRPHGRPRSCKQLADENEVFQLGGETKHTLLLLPPKESDVGTPTDRFKWSIPTRRRSNRPPRCKLTDNGEPRIAKPRIGRLRCKVTDNEEPRMAKQRIANVKTEGIIILALPAQAQQPVHVSQSDVRKGRVKK